MENYKLKNGRMQNYEKHKNFEKNIKNDAGDAWDPFKKIRLTKIMYYSSGIMHLRPLWCQLGWTKTMEFIRNNKTYK